MIKRSLKATTLIPTDAPRKLMAILDLVPLYVQNRWREIEPIIVVPYEDYFLICSGNHRAAAAYICKGHVRAKILTEPRELGLLTEEKVAEARSLVDLRILCLNQASERRYVGGGWNEYLRDLAARPVALE